MKYDDLVGRVMNELELGKRAEGVRAIRATLTPLSERLQEGEATDLAGSLPMEIDYYVLSAEHGQKFGFNEFIDRAAEIENCDRSDALWHVKNIFKVLADAVPQGEIEDIQGSLPEEYSPLFEQLE
ncbi:MAG: DUF2267 domain-containing protein [Candidatus Nanohalobium sp.]